MGSAPENEEKIAMPLRHSNCVLGRAAVLAGFATLACGSIGGGTDAEKSAVTTVEQRGELLFTEETFDGNGRVCSTCHEPDQFGTITPEFVQAQFEHDPEGPLFRDIDSDDGRGGSYRRLLEHATIRIPFTTPYDEVLGRAIRRCARPEAINALVFRGNPTMFNAALEEVLMHDGRERGDLESQARNAIDTHAEPGRKPAPEELTAIARFQESLYSNTALKAFLDNGAELRLPDGNTPEEVRGRAFFEPDRQCGICHSGPMLNRTSEFHPDSEGARVESTSVGAEHENPYPKYEWCFVDPATNEISPPPGIPLEGAPDYVLNGRIFRRAVADPGIALIRDPTTDFPFTFPDGTEVTATSALLSAIVGLPLFKIPTLWGTPDTAPYFHDNSAKNLDEVLDHYNFMFREDFPRFAERVGCDPDATDCMSERDKADIIAFMQLLSFEGGGIRPAGAR
jgi:cytochrome c peroxidase